MTTTNKYLGMFIMDKMKDDVYVKRQVKCIYTRGTILITNLVQSEDRKH